MPTKVSRDPTAMRIAAAFTAWIIAMLVSLSFAAALVSSGTFDNCNILAGVICFMSSAACAAAYRRRSEIAGIRIAGMIWAVLSATMLLLGFVIDWHSVKTVNLLIILSANALGCLLGVTFLSHKSYKKAKMKYRNSK